MAGAEFRVRTKKKIARIDVTKEVERVAKDLRAKSGALLVSVPHTTAAVTVGEGTGRKGADHFRRRRATVADRYIGILATPADELAAQIAEKIIARFLNGETDAVYILYSRFRSALSQVPTLEKLLPVAVTETSETETQQMTEYLYEPGVEQLLASLLPRITEVAAQRALLEATASEHGARMTAMDSATSNAAKMIGSLTLQMNRARQASITRELMEIVGTAEALK